MTSFKSPKRCDGAFAYLLRTYDANGNEVTTEKFYKIRDSTQNRAEVIALIMALQRMRKKCELKIYTECQYLKNGIDSWIESWAQKGWVNAKGQPVANAEEWRQVASLIEGHEIEVVVNKDSHHEFYSWMQKGIKKVCLKNSESSTAGKR